MKILKLKKAKLGDKFCIIKMTYKNFWGVTKTRDVMCSSVGLWRFADNGDIIHEDSFLTMFDRSSEIEYTVNS